MNDSVFDPTAFIDAAVTEAMDTKTVPVPVGEYQAIVESIKTRTWVSKDDPTKSGVALDVQWEVLDENVKALLGRDKVTVKQGVMLDTTAGRLDLGKGKNISLGRLRSALGLNNPGEAFSLSMLTGRMGMVTVSHRVDGEDIYAEVRKVLPF